MANFPSYTHLDPDEQREYNHWNAKITANPGIRLCPALSNPPKDYGRLFTDGYEEYEDLKKDLEDYVFNAGVKIVTKYTNPKSVGYACSRGRMQ